MLPLTITGTKDETEIKTSFVICVNQIHNYRHVHKFMQFVEYQRNIMGITKIIIYDFDHVSDDVLKAVKYYIKIGLVSVQPFRLPVKTSKRPPKNKVKDGLKTWGQGMQVNDCLYRNMDKYTYIVALDLEEYIMSHKKSIRTYRDIINSLDKEDKYQTASYNFNNAFFYMSIKDSDRSNAFLFKHSNRNKFEPARSKCIVNPRRVIVNDVHPVIMPIDGYSNKLEVNETIAFVHHYQWPSESKYDQIDETHWNYNQENVLENVGRELNFQLLMKDNK